MDYLLIHLKGQSYSVTIRLPFFIMFTSRNTPEILTGKKFGKLTAIDIDGRSDDGRISWLCICECGREVSISAVNLKRYKMPSCGCYIHSINKKHGHCVMDYEKNHTTTTGEYRVWTAMKKRCYNPNYENFERYGGRGIKVCDKWLGKHGFENFLADMGKRPSPKHTLDRFPNKNGNYEPTNCRYATSFQQNGNMESNVWIEFNNKKMIIADWARFLNIKPARINAFRRKTKEINPICFYVEKLNLYHLFMSS